MSPTQEQKSGDESSDVIVDEYVTVRLPRELSNRIDALIKFGGDGLRSRAEFVTEVVRQGLRNSEAEAMRRIGFYQWLEQEHASGGILEMVRATTQAPTGRPRN